MPGTQRQRQPAKLKPSYDPQQTWPPPMEGSSRAMLATAGPSCLDLVIVLVNLYNAVGRAAAHSWTSQRLGVRHRLRARLSTTWWCRRRRRRRREINFQKLSSCSTSLYCCRRSHKARRECTTKYSLVRRVYSDQTRPAVGPTRALVVGRPFDDIMGTSFDAHCDGIWKRLICPFTALR